MVLPPALSLGVWAQTVGLHRETLRLNPPASAAIRRTVGALPVGKWTLPSGPLSAQPEPMVQRATVLVPKRGLLIRAA